MDSRRDPLELVGKRIGGRKYLVHDVVDETTFSVVYRATHLVWERDVAIKVFHVGRGATAETRAELLASFIREGALLGALSETCAAICQAREIGALSTAEGGRVPYMVLEWLDGRSLEAVMAAERAERPGSARRRTLPEVLELLGSIAHALSCAHARGISHCDIKPGNILVLAPEARGEIRCKLLDFGVARVEGQAVGHPRARRPFTPAFGAPEQFDESYGVAGPWTDVFALALTVVELLTGSDALSGDDVFVLGHQACDKARRPTPRSFGVDLGDEVEQVLSRALAVDPAWRFRDMGEFWSELTRAARPVAVVATGPVVVAEPPPNAPVGSPRQATTSAEVPLPRRGGARRASLARASRQPRPGRRAAASPFPLVVALALGAALSFGTDRRPSTGHAATPHSAIVAMAR